METKKKKLIKSELKEMVRQELQSVLAERKKVKNEEAITISSLSKDIATASGSGDKLVLRFLQGVAKKFDYPIAKAAIFVKDTIKSLGY